MNSFQNQFFEGVFGMFSSFFKYCEKENVGVDLNALFDRYIKEEINMNLNPIAMLKTANQLTVDEVDNAHKKKAVKKPKPVVNEDNGAVAAVLTSSSEGEGKKTGKKTVKKNDKVERENQTSLSLNDLNNEAWVKNTKADTLKNLCIERGLKFSGSKNVLIQQLIKYEEQFNNCDENEPEKAEVHAAEDKIVKMRRTKKTNTLAAPHPNGENIIIEVIKRCGLNLVDAGENEDYMLVLKGSNDLADGVVYGHVNKDDLIDEVSMPDVHGLTEEVIKKAQSFKLPFDIPENY